MICILLIANHQFRDKEADKNRSIRINRLIRINKLITINRFITRELSAIYDLIASSC